MVHSITARPENSALSNIIKQRPEDNDVKRFACQIMEDTGSFEYTRYYVLASKKKVLEHIAALGGNVMLEKLVEDITKVCPAPF